MLPRLFDGRAHGRQEVVDVYMDCRLEPDDRAISI